MKMKPTDKIKKQIKKMQLKASAELDAKIYARFSNAPAKLDMKIPAETQPAIWRIIMKSTVIKLAAVLIVGAAILISIPVLTGRESSATQNEIGITDVAELLEEMTDKSVIVSDETMMTAKIDVGDYKGLSKDEAIAQIYNALKDAGFDTVEGVNEIYIIPAGATARAVNGESSTPMMGENQSDNVLAIVDIQANELIRVCFDTNSLEPGQYVEIMDSYQLEFPLVQVTTSSIGKEAGDFPAYATYIDFEIRSNIDLNLVTQRNTRGSLLEHDNWDAYIVGPDTVIGNGNFSNITLCVSTWRFDIGRLLNAADENTVSQVTILIQPDKK